MSSNHHATFTWGAGPQSVFIAGNFNNWSGDASPLEKQPDGAFSAAIPMPWGEKQAFKYVVDGEWKVREDEAKEWDAAGNMNNVYSAPHAPASNGTGPAAAAVPAPTGGATSVPSSTAPDTAAPSTTTKSTEPETLMAASAPRAASGGSSAALGGYMLGAVSGRTSAPSKGLTPVPDTSSRTTTGAPTTAASTTTTYATTEPTPVRTESAATISTAGASTAEAPQTYMGSAMAALGAIVGGAATAVENATGVNLGQSHQPMTVDEAESKGINVDSLEKKDAPTDTVSPAGTAPSNSYVAALEEKMDGLKTTDTTGAGSSLPNGGASSSTEHLLRQYPADLPDLSASYDNAPTPLPADDKPEYDIPAQVDTGDNHNHVPMPVITDMSERDPKKDRTLDSTTNSDSAGTKPITSDPSVSAEAAKKDAEANPGTTGSTGAAAAGLIPEGTTVAKPDAKSANLDAPAPATTSAAATPADDTATKISAAAATTSPGMAGTTPATTGKAAVTPATPAKGAALIATPASPQSNTSTPAKPAHKKETTDADMRKRKSSFFGKIKNAFKDKK